MAYTGNASAGSNLISAGTSTLPKFSAAEPVAQWVKNLGISYASGTGTFSVLSQNGTALSVNNPAYIIIMSKATPGIYVTIPVTSSQTFIDANGSSTITGNLFGLTTSIAYTNDLPFFIYAVLNDTENAISFMISRIPHACVAPASGNIGKTGSAIASTQGSFFALDNPTVTDYDGNPCVCVGAFRMRMNASNAWTVQALSNASGVATGIYAGADGIGQFHDESKFMMAEGQFGASANTFFKPNSGTAPVFSTRAAGFYIRKNGGVLYFCNMTNNAAGAGAGSVVAQLALPYVCSDGTTTPAVGQFTNGSPTNFGLIASIADNSNNMSFIAFDPNTFAALNNSSFTAGAGSVFNTGLTYQARYS